MSELLMSNSSKKTVVVFQTLSVSVSNFIFSCCLTAFSQPIYLCYFLFFSPYIVKLLSFLSPLFIPTSIVLLCLLLSFQDPNSASFLLDEELELYEILFETSRENAVEQEVQETVDKFLIHGTTAKEDETEHQWSKIQEREDFDEISGSHVEGQEVKQLGTVFKKVAAAEELEREESNANLVNKSIPRKRQSSRNFSSSLSDGLGVDGVGMSPGLGEFGSVRKEKEWRRTLACKLFEERHNADGGEEGMDLLWEKYEDDLTRARGGRRRERRNKGGGAYPVAQPEKQHGAEEEAEDRDDASEDHQQICCLQALKFSAGKVNIVRMSRVLRGIGWLHNGRRHKKM